MGTAGRAMGGAMGAAGARAWTVVASTEAVALAPSLPSSPSSSSSSSSAMASSPASPPELPPLCSLFMMDFCLRAIRFFSSVRKDAFPPRPGGGASASGAARSPAFLSATPCWIPAKRPASPIAGGPPPTPLGAIRGEAGAGGGPRPEGSGGGDSTPPGGIGGGGGGGGAPAMLGGGGGGGDSMPPGGMGGGGGGGERPFPAAHVVLGSGGGGGGSIVDAAESAKAKGGFAVCGGGGGGGEGVPTAAPTSAVGAGAGVRGWRSVFKGGGGGGGAAAWSNTGTAGRTAVTAGAATLGAAATGGGTAAASLVYGATRVSPDDLRLGGGPPPSDCPLPCRWACISSCCFLSSDVTRRARSDCAATISGSEFIRTYRRSALSLRGEAGVPPDEELRSGDPAASRRSHSDTPAAASDEPGICFRMAAKSSRAATHM
mmetsp:Transcript_8748/g.26342  ORF Transcript_8748/g.26342 Transcript_8748/m.26342 type:complete len:431 (+) Transcript_8748:1625-2917(+)